MSRGLEWDIREAQRQLVIMRTVSEREGGHFSASQYLCLSQGQCCNGTAQTAWQDQEISFIQVTGQISKYSKDNGRQGTH